MSKTVKFNVAMTCGGCSGAVKRILGKIDNVEDVDANLETKIVTVTCADEVEDTTLLDALKKWSESSGKAVSLITE